MSSSRFTFWQRWLVLVSIGAALFGLAFIILPTAMENLFITLFFGGASTDALFGVEAGNYIRFVYGVLGAVMLGWMISLTIIASGAFGKRDRSAWNAIAVGAGVWFVVDSAFSLASGFPANAALNVGFMVLFTIPLAATFRAFYPASAEQQAVKAR